MYNANYFIPGILKYDDYLKYYPNYYIFPYKSYVYEIIL